MKQHLLLLSLCCTLIVSCQAQGNNQRRDTAQAKPAMAESQYVVHRADTRGQTKEDWLLSRHTFSFNNYYDRNRVGFGALLVLNDDWVKAGAGFPLHRHDEMEIISIPLIGGVAHKDSKGSAGITSVDKDKGYYTVQQMTAGSGLSHSEFNASTTDSVRFLQIWVAPNKHQLAPAYHQKQFSFAAQHNKWQTLISPDDSAALFINQQAVFSRADVDAGKVLDYTLKYNEGVYAFILEGKATVNGVELNRRDGIGITDAKELSINAGEDLQILVIEVPVKQRL
jgi:redox-sensitive bicupin YhaK (pirin superfamily)